MSHKVIQWTTGHVGKEAVKGILAHPDLELVGTYAWSESKAGKDIGELCGTDLLGIKATSDVDELLALGADCVCYMPNRPDVDEMVRILEAGLNMVCSYFVTGTSLGEEQRHRLLRAAGKGNATLFGSGIFPGFAPFLAALMATASRDFRCVRFLEAVDLSHYQAFANFANLGWGQPPDRKWGDINRLALGTYSECIDMMAELLGIPVTEKRFDYEYAITPDNREFFGFPVPAGTIAGQKCVWSGMVEDEPAVQLDVVWKAGGNLEPDWPLSHGYTMEVEGNPNIRTRVTFSPSTVNPQDRGAGGADLANQVTAMPVINAIPAVCAASAGIKTYADLPLIAGRYVR
ncbi:MAG: dihydrodipicolinate reductase [Dehalococcoidia bacterium]